MGVSVECVYLSIARKELAAILLVVFETLSIAHRRQRGRLNNKRGHRLSVAADECNFPGFTNCAFTLSGLCVQSAFRCWDFGSAEAVCYPSEVWSAGYLA